MEVSKMQVLFDEIILLRNAFRSLVFPERRATHGASSGTSPRIVARTGPPVPGSYYLWRSNPRQEAQREDRHAFALLPVLLRAAAHARQLRCGSWQSARREGQDSRI